MQQQQQPPNAKIIWFALIMSVVIYVVIAFVAVPRAEQRSFDEALDNPMVMAMYGAAIVMFLLSLAMPRILAPRREFPSATPATSDVATRQRRLQALIVSWAMAESAAIFGLVAAFTTRSPFVVLPTVLLSLVAFMILFPTEERLS